ncbi:hypothetical protein [Jidongwangia harbinensis]|uniref:hypothetical protein n=1 Tax=Jidongwangia harbinensis TaxID=2878561 RepID=UPI001CD9B241|nr:hypothetical protein [Jidongwangia harbinensis]MCA2218937.1 hypothetical protein [Jidongwangia harbinensis]
MILKIARVAALAAVLGLAGCANATPSTPPGDSADARRALEGSLGGVRAGNYTFTRTGGGQSEGAVHLPGSSLIAQGHGPSVLRTGSGFYLRYRIHGDGYASWAKLYQKHAGDADAKQRAELARVRRVMAVLDGTHWVRADEKRLTAAAAEEDLSGLERMPPVPTAEKPDVTGATELVTAAVTARRDGDTVTGTLDATKVDAELGVFANDPYYFYGPRASAMPYRARLDAQGRLTELTVEVPGQLEAPASQPPAGFPSDAPTAPADPPVVITITRYGETPEQPVPKGVTDLDPGAYEMLTNDVD